MLTENLHERPPIQNIYYIDIHLILMARYVTAVQDNAGGEQFMWFLENYLSRYHLSVFDSQCILLYTVTICVALRYCLICILQSVSKMVQTDNKYSRWYELW